MPEKELSESENTPQPYWARLLLAFREQRRTGLTIPFFIGAAHRPFSAALGEEAAFERLNALLIDMRDATLHSERLRIARCNRLREPVAALYRAREYIDERERLSSPTNPGAAFYVEGQYISGNGGIDSLLTHFWRRYRPVLICGHYSFNRGDYGPFTPGELEFIASVCD